MELAKEPDWLSVFRRSGRYACPCCGPSRRPEHRNERTLTVTVDDRGKTAYCHHCSARAVQNHRNPEAQRPMQPAPKLVSADKLSDHIPLTAAAISYLAGRQIPVEVAQYYGVVSGTRYFPAKGDEPAGKCEALGFRYAGDQTYAIKWRTLEGKRWVADGGPNNLWGPKLKPGSPLIICEGEVDAMSIFTATGICTKSLPSGSADKISPQSKMSFLDQDYDEINSASKIILCLDNDQAGNAMKEELARRIGREKVWDAKHLNPGDDANSVLVQSGPDALAALIEGAKPWPIEGLAKAENFRKEVRKLHKEGLPRGKSTGWSSLDKLVTIQPGMIYIVTGRPGSGKSTWLDNLMVNMADRLKWNWAIFSPESPPSLQITRLISIKEETPIASIRDDDIDRHIDWVENHFTFLVGDGMSTIDSIVERVKVAVTRYGIRGVVIDPFNYIRTPGQTMDVEGVNELLAKVKLLSVSTDTAIFLVAHPAKPQQGTGGDWMPGGYAVSGAAHFYNRADFGLTLGRPEGIGQMEGDSEFMVWKCKWSHLGSEGRAYLDFDPATQRFSQRRTAVVYGDVPF